MIVCHCRAVNDGRVRAEIEAGASCEADLGLRCGAGTGCGGCLPALERLLAEYGLAPLAPMAGALPTFAA